MKEIEFIELLSKKSIKHCTMPLKDLFYGSRKKEKDKAPGKISARAPPSK
jgi:hypothetical protein